MVDCSSTLIGSERMWRQVGLGYAAISRWSGGLLFRLVQRGVVSPLLEWECAVQTRCGSGMTCPVITTTRQEVCRNGRFHLFDRIFHKVNNLKPRSFGRTAPLEREYCKQAMQVGLCWLPCINHLWLTQHLGRSQTRTPHRHFTTSDPRDVAREWNCNDGTIHAANIEQNDREETSSCG
jgi:hypothetical protein